MAEEPAAEIQLLRKHKAKLIEILSSDADFVLQHADARSLLSPHGYQLVKYCHIPSVKMTELLDHVIQRGLEAAHGLLELLKDQALQETFPLLNFLKEQQVTLMSSEITRKKKPTELQETIPAKKICNNSSDIVTEKQLMTAARAIGRSWREIGRLALDIPSVKLEQIEEDHPLHVERVFAMLRYWRISQKEKATTSRLHCCLSQDTWALPPEGIAFLLETN